MKNKYYFITARHYFAILFGVWSKKIKRNNNYVRAGRYNNIYYTVLKTIA